MLNVVCIVIINTNVNIVIMIVIVTITVIVITCRAWLALSFMHPLAFSPLSPGNWSGGPIEDTKSVPVTNLRQKFVLASFSSSWWCNSFPIQYKLWWRLSFDRLLQHLRRILRQKAFLLQSVSIALDWRRNVFNVELAFQECERHKPRILSNCRRGKYLRRKANKQKEKEKDGTHFILNQVLQFELCISLPLFGRIGLGIVFFYYELW